LNNLNEVAENYHGGEFPDQWIENACQKNELDWLLAKIGPNADVLDLGYGDGLLSPEFARHAEQYTLVEGSPELAQKAVKALTDIPNSTVFTGLFENWDPEPGRLFDVVIASHVLEHVNDPVMVLKRALTWLRPGGVVVGIVPNACSVHRIVGLSMGISQSLYSLSERDHLVGHQRVYDIDTLTADVEASGFVVHDLRGFFLKPVDNRQLLALSPEAVHALIALGDLIGPRHAANIGFVLSAVTSSHN